MTLVRILARPMLASTFVVAGLDAARNPGKLAPKASTITGPIARQVPALPQDPEQLVRLNGAIQVLAGALLGLGKFPRLAALVLLASLVPTTFAGHPFWEMEDPEQRKAQRTQFLKNVSLAGGLLLAAVDTSGNPSLVWRAQHARQHAGKATTRGIRTTKREAKLAAKAAKAEAKARLPL